jgi:hypothetical protein
MQNHGNPADRIPTRVAALLVSVVWVLAGCDSGGTTSGDTTSGTKQAPLPSWRQSAGAASPESPVFKGPGLTVADAPKVVFNGFADEGHGHPTELRANRPAMIELGGKRHPLPCTLWFADETAPGGDSPVTYRLRPGGSGYHDFYFAGGATPCPVMSPEGKPLAALVVKLSVEAISGGRTKTLLNLQLVEP